MGNKTSSKATDKLAEMEALLRPRLAGELRMDSYSRALYATDASIYQVMPVGVVLPRHEDDIHATLAAAAELGVPIIARGAGSSLDGQAIGEGIILDVSKYMSRVIDIDPVEKTAVVQPGVVLDVLNKQLQPYGLAYGPDPASASRATMGGIIGNNSTGSHSILYGMTHDHIVQLRALLADGTEIITSDLSRQQFQGKLLQNDREGEIYRATAMLIDQHRDEIEKRFSPHWRSVSGYGLNRLLGDEWNLSRLLAGSEGTLAVTLEAKVGLVALPKKKGLAMVHFDDIMAAMAGVPSILETEPAAIEYIDHFLLDLIRRAPVYAPYLDIIEGNPNGILIVEYYGENGREIDAKLDELRRVCNSGSRSASVQVVAEQDMANVWKVRKAGLGLLMTTKSDWKPIPFIEDGSVPPEKLTVFMEGINSILQEHGVEAAIYAHASAGCLHIRPLLNLKLADDIERMRSITAAWCDLIIRLRGSLSGEHGDGRARSEWNERLFGPVLYDAFARLKNDWDPQGLLNPGNIVDGPSMTEALRYGASYRTQGVPDSQLLFAGSEGFARAVELCSGIGACRKVDSEVMCPSFMATRDEEHSTRGRANALRAAMSGLLPPEELFSPRMHGVLDLCLECKACAAECPSKVDMAKIKYEYLYHYHQQHGLPLRSRMFGHIHQISRLGSLTSPVSNRLLTTRLARSVMSRVGIDSRRSLPPFVRQGFSQWFKKHRPQAQAGSRGQVLLFADTFMLYNYPAVGIAATNILEAAGYEVLLPEMNLCCGRPMISKGMLAEARELLGRNVELLLPYVRRGIPILGVEPSCLLTFRDEAVELLRTDEAKELAGRSLLLDEWIMERHKAGELDLLQWRGERKDILLHGHCHHKSSGIGDAVSSLNLPPAYRASLIDAGCCGMAGAFGFEKEHYDISRTIGEDRLFPAIRASRGATIAVTGVSCRQQVEHFTDHQARNWVEVLADDVELN